LESASIEDQLLQGGENKSSYNKDNIDFIFKDKKDDGNTLTA